MYLKYHSEHIFDSTQAPVAQIETFYCIRMEITVFILILVGIKFGFTVASISLHNSATRHYVYSICDSQSNEWRRQRLRYKSYWLIDMDVYVCVLKHTRIGLSLS
jgi:hypothetical protein